jgi:hypothetical protein
MIRAITANFALMTLAGVALAWFQPALFTWMTDGSIRVAASRCFRSDWASSCWRWG